MAVLYVTEYTNVGRELKANISQSAAEPALAQQSLAIGAGSVASVNFNAKTRLVRVHSDAVCSIKIAAGAVPVAVATAQRMAANQTEYFAITPEAIAAGCQIAVITNT